MFCFDFGQIKDKSKNLEETVARQVDNIDSAIAMSREDLKSQHSELQKSIETVAAKLRADNSTNVTNQVGHVPFISHSHANPGELINSNFMIDSDDWRIHCANTDRPK